MAMALRAWRAESTRVSSQHTAYNKACMLMICGGTRKMLYAWRSHVARTKVLHARSSAGAFRALRVAFDAIKQACVEPFPFARMCKNLKVRMHVCLHNYILPCCVSVRVFPDIQQELMCVCMYF
jgi:hypothetical protein